MDKKELKEWSIQKADDLLWVYSLSRAKSKEKFLRRQIAAMCRAAYMVGVYQGRKDNR